MIEAKQKSGFLSNFLKASLVAIVCGGVFGVALVQDQAASSGEGRAPVIRVSEKDREMGAVDPWDIVEHIFTVFNDGDRVLRIERVSPD